MKNLILYAALAASTANGQLTFERLLKADSEPQNWLTYSGSYKGWRHSKLAQINRQNARISSWPGYTRCP